MSLALGVPGPTACLAPRSARPRDSNSGSCAQAWAEHQQSHRGAAGTSKSGGDGSTDGGSSAGPAGGTRHGCPTIHGGGTPRPRQG